MSPPFPHRRANTTRDHVAASLEGDGRLLRIVLSRPPANILDSAMLEEIRTVLEDAMGQSELRAILFDHEGPNFSFGASVEEHLPDQVEEMLAGFHGLFRDLMSLAVPVLAAVRGHALGAGCELATFCHRVFVSDDAHLGQPEIKLGVFAPVASIVLPARVGQARADDLLITGRSVPASEAVDIGLADAIVEDPTAAAQDWFDQHLAGKSAVGLRYAVRAARGELHERMRAELDEMEHLYLNELMATDDAVEGLRAFLEKRRPQWSDR
ncbi:MAG: cyclohexa-1,5-dienecarbonyl-CoA hydratase [Planctomycetes bacterium]|nr:cyclohexa-1,5-dienecarbonyl-CoA hydratase [Planctomycetota bacterium]